MEKEIAVQDYEEAIHDCLLELASARASCHLIVIVRLLVSWRLEAVADSS